MNQASHVKILFRLSRRDGYPPVDCESLWAISSVEGYRIDSIPFYARLVSIGDLVSASRARDGLLFDRVLSPGGHSTLRVILRGEELVSKIRGEVEAMGCSTELSNIPTFFSIDVPKNVNYYSIVELLRGHAEEGVLDYEEASIQHAEVNDPG